jgi:hypothetical protein
MSSVLAFWALNAPGLRPFHRSCASVPPRTRPRSDADPRAARPLADLSFRPRQAQSGHDAAVIAAAIRQWRRLQPDLLGIPPSARVVSAEESMASSGSVRTDHGRAAGLAVVIDEVLASGELQAGGSSVKRANSAGAALAAGGRRACRGGAVGAIASAVRDDLAPRIACRFLGLVKLPSSGTLRSGPAKRRVRWPVGIWTGNQG